MRPMDRQVSKCCVILLVALIIWEAHVLHDFTKKWPNSIWTGSHTELNATCSRLFDLLSKSLMLAAFAVTVEIVAACFRPLRRIAEGGLCLATGAMVALSAYGFYIVVNINQSECSDCLELYSSAYRLFVVLILCGVCLCSCGACCCASCIFGFLLAAHYTKNSKPAGGKNDPKQPLAKSDTSPPTYRAVG